MDDIYGMSDKMESSFNNEGILLWGVETYQIFG